MQRAPRVVHHCRGCFEGVAFIPISRQKSESNVGIGKTLSLQYPADPDSRSIRFQFNEIQTETVRLVAPHWSIDKVAPRVVEIANAFVADIANERRIVQQFEDEC